MDFKDGVIFCELLGILRQSPLPGVVTSPTATIDSSIKNIGLAINELKRLGIRKAQNLSAESVYNSEDAMFDLLECIKQAFDPGTSPSPSKIEQTDTARYLQQPPVSDKENERIVQSPAFAYSASESIPCERSSRVSPSIHQKSTFVSLKQLPASASEAELAVVQTQGIPLQDPRTGTMSFPKPTKPLVSFKEPQYSQKALQTVPATHVQKTPKTARAPPALVSRNRDDFSRGHKPSCFKSLTELDEIEDAVLAPPRVDIKTKQRVLEWLEEIQLIKEGAVTIANFPQYCRNGVLLSDLVTRLEGTRKVPLKGINRNPKSGTEVLSNLRKYMRHLQQYEKMNSRFLWSEKAILRGDEDVIWGLLDDMWYFYHGKTSPHFVKPNPQVVAGTEASRSKGGSLLLWLVRLVRKL